MSRPTRYSYVGLAVLLAGAVAVGCAHIAPHGGAQKRETRRALFAALTPAKLANCTLQRYGDARDGGYLMCENLMGEAQAAYSYGVDGRDQWGCDVSRQLRTTVHEYDCFNLTRPMCDRGTFQFHEECVGNQTTTKEGRPYDTLPNHLVRNNDAGKRLIVKMDVEGSEWESILAAPDSVLASIDQLILELHGTDEPRFVEAVEKLTRQFYVVHFHANNHACSSGLAPFTAWANEVLLVNKRIGVPDTSGGLPVLPNPLDAPNAAAVRDCQPTFRAH